MGQDVRELAGLLGEVFAEQTSPAALETVEALRTAAIDYREGELDSRATLQSTLADCSAARETVVPRAFTAYFELINLAEERQRVRAIRTATEAEALEHGLDEAAEALARSDMEIAAEYARIADPELRDRFLPRLQDAHARAVELTLDVADRDRLIQKDWLAECLRRRNPYVDPLNLLQVRLLEREDRTAREEQTLRLTVKGIAAGMKNTG